ncbi:hypothetical protein NL676_002810 [Syzygium grande]|nr:hypothetical protein NL676_002810 [Syzygium grande]
MSYANRSGDSPTFVVRPTFWLPPIDLRSFEIGFANFRKYSGKKPLSSLRRPLSNRTDLKEDFAKEDAAKLNGFQISHVYHVLTG